MAARARPSGDPSVRDHQEWLGYLQPTGLVVSPQVLVDQQVIIDRGALADLQANLLAALAVAPDPDSGREGRFGPFVEREAGGSVGGLALRFLGWPAARIECGREGPSALDPSLTVSIPELGATLAPTAALRSPEGKADGPRHMLLVEDLPADTPLDERFNATHLWETTRSGRFERLLTEAGVPLGVLCNGKVLRLFYAPRGETAGHITFDVAYMTGTAGRLIVAGLHELLKAFRLTNAPSKALLPALCETSRKYQSTVSAALAEQVLEALYELVRGFQSAHDATHGELLAGHLAGGEDARQDIYRGLLRTLMRSVFLLFAEDRDLLPGGDLYYRNYSLHGLYERLREDDGRHHDTMDSRYGAWSQLLATFRLVYRGSAHPALALPARQGYLFDPEAFPFLEGRTLASRKPPLVSDGCVYRVLEKLLLLKGERLSYRTLDVEQIGSVYETMMGFRMTVAPGASIALKPKKKGGAPIGLDLDAVLAEAPAKRAGAIESATETTLTAKQKDLVKAAETHDALVAALGVRVSLSATPRIVPKGAMLLQPSDERRRSGSHYTPRSLTQPIVAKTLEPILERLGPQARPDQVLGLKICDPAMGSGAFLVEACRQLGARLEQAWLQHGQAPRVTAQDDLTTLARRMVAQRCVYGVDRNDMAVDLAKLSLWLATLAKDHPFTFLDHALRHGDTLVGLDLAQLRAFHWDPSQPERFVSRTIDAKLREAVQIREEIRRADDVRFSEVHLTGLLQQAELATAQLKVTGDLVIAAFFGEAKDPQRLGALQDFAEHAQALLNGHRDPQHARAASEAQATLAAHALVAFHWPVAFPEVFLRDQPGFDAVVGNPPFLGGRNLTETAGDRYSQFLVSSIPEATAGADLVARFFRRAFALLRAGGALGLIATNTIGQGDTRSAGLRWICTHGGEIYAVRKRIKWPGEAAVVVSVIWLIKASYVGAKLLDGRRVNRITAFLSHAGGHDDPARLAASSGLAYVGNGVLGMGFTFDDTDAKGLATPLAEMRRLLADNRRNREVIFPYVGGEEVNSNPTHAHHRYVINFGERDRGECDREWPELMAILDRKVRPERAKKSATKYPRMVLEWWKHWNARPELCRALRGAEHALVISRVGQHCAFAMLPADVVFADSVVAFPGQDVVGFSCLQSRAHELWARFFASSMKDDLRYTPSDCLETFPFPVAPNSRRELEHAGRAYLEHRAAIMVRNGEGLTKTYNRFHDSANHEPDIVRLRQLHTAMDRAVLDAYGWTDISVDCDFFPDYLEEDEDGNEVPTSIRYRWPDEVRDEVLARLLDLNAKRHAEEVAAGLVSPDGKRLKGAGAEDPADEGDPEAGAEAEAPAVPPRGRGKRKGRADDGSGRLDFGRKP